MKPNPSRFLWCLFWLLTAIGGLSFYQQKTRAQSLQIPLVLAQNAYRPDTLSSEEWWLSKVKTLATQSQGQQYQNCLFGDSISTGLKDTLGKDTANFAMGGLSSVSLVTQLKYLSAAGVQCQRAIIAIGTNDAWYITSDNTFVTNLRQSVKMVQSMGASRILLVPAFYSTVPASQDPKLAGPLQRVDEVNTLMQVVAASEQVDVMNSGLEALFRNHALKDAVTFDGVHLNDNGNAIYRQALLQVLKDAP